MSAQEAPRDSSSSSGLDEISYSQSSSFEEGPFDPRLAALLREIREEMWSVVEDFAEQGHPITDPETMGRVEHLIDTVIIVPGDFEIVLNEEGITPYYVFPSSAPAAVIAVPFEKFLRELLDLPDETTAEVPDLNRMTVDDL